MHQACQGQSTQNGNGSTNLYNYLKQVNSTLRLVCILIAFDGQCFGII